MREFVEAEMEAGIEEPDKPVFQVFVALLGLSGFEGGANYSVGFVLHAPDQIAVGLAQKRGIVTEGGKVLADFFGVGVVLFELHPARFLRQLAQLADESVEVFLSGYGVHIMSGYPTVGSRLCPTVLPAA